MYENNLNFQRFMINCQWLIRLQLVYNEEQFKISLSLKRVVVRKMIRLIKTLIISLQPTWLCSEMLRMLKELITTKENKSSKGMSPWASIKHNIQMKLRFKAYRPLMYLSTRVYKSKKSRTLISQPKINIKCTDKFLHIESLRKGPSKICQDQAIKTIEELKIY